MSASLSSLARISRPGSLIRLRQSVRWLRRSCSIASLTRSPSGLRGFSIQITSAPWSAMTWAAKGPAIMLPAYTSRSPSSDPNRGTSASRVIAGFSSQSGLGFPFSSHR